jgi:plasmid stabilization system protein ParE
MVTKWTPQEIAELRKAYDYISKDSPQNARKFVDADGRYVRRILDS